MAKMVSKEINVTFPALPPLAEVMELLEEPWQTGRLTHDGPLLLRLEDQLREAFGVKNIVSCVNGTIAIQMAMKALGINGGEIITTPFTWIATCSAILWENCVPVFVDIDPETLNIDPNKIEAAISHRTVGIMPVHVFSNPCEVLAIESISKKHDLPVIYDAAHAVYVQHKGQSVFDYGDISTTSFHATKIFNTGEGGACFSSNDDLHMKLRRIRFFGYDEERNYAEDGTNGKMTEIHAALGLANLKYQGEVLRMRKATYELYHEILSDVEDLTWQKIDPKSYNYGYVPVIFSSEEQLLKVKEEMAKNQVFGRRYFYPALNQIRTCGPYSPAPISEDIAKRILCLPSAVNLPLEEVASIAKMIRKAL